MNNKIWMAFLYFLFCLPVFYMSFVMPHQVRTFLCDIVMKMHKDLDETKKNHRTQKIKLKIFQALDQPIMMTTNDNKIEFANSNFVDFLEKTCYS